MKRREFNVFTMSFLDCICCGFGAVILLFVIVNAKQNGGGEDVVLPPAPSPEVQEALTELEVEKRLAERDIQERSKGFEEIRKKEQVVQTEEDHVRSALDEAREAIRANDGQEASLRAELRQLEAAIAKLRTTEKGLQSKLPRAIPGQTVMRHGGGKRQYLSGLKMSGKRILLLVDASSSMLGETLPEVVQYKSGSERDRLNAPKWKRTQRIVDILLAQIPADSQYQVVAFHEEPVPLADGWQPGNSEKSMVACLQALAAMAPERGTNLQRAFLLVRELSPPPDCIFLVTDGLPTQSPENPSSRGLISSAERERLGMRAISVLPRHVPVNTLLLPIEGDPASAWVFWTLAFESKGSFLSLPRDWP